MYGYQYIIMSIEINVPSGRRGISCCRTSGSSKIPLLRMLSEVMMSARLLGGCLPDPTDIIVRKDKYHYFTMSYDGT